MKLISLAISLELVTLKVTDLCMMTEDNGRDQSMIFYLSVKVRVFSYLLVLCMMEEGNYDTSFEYDNDIWKKSMD